MCVSATPFKPLHGISYSFVGINTYKYTVKACIFLGYSNAIIPIDQLTFGAKFSWNWPSDSSCTYMKGIIEQNG